MQVSGEGSTRSAEQMLVATWLCTWVKACNSSSKAIRAAARADLARAIAQPGDIDLLTALSFLMERTEEECLQSIVKAVQAGLTKVPRPRDQDKKRAA